MVAERTCIMLPSRTVLPITFGIRMQHAAPEFLRQHNRAVRVRPIVALVQQSIQHRPQTHHFKKMAIHYPRMDFPSRPNPSAEKSTVENVPILLIVFNAPQCR